MTITLTTIVGFVGLSLLASFVSTLVIEKPNDVVDEDAPDYLIRLPIFYEKFYRSFGVSLSFGTISIAALGNQVTAKTFWDWNSPTLSVVLAIMVAVWVAYSLQDRKTPIKNGEWRKILLNILICMFVFSFVACAASSRDSITDGQIKPPADKSANSPQQDSDHNK